MRKIIIFATFAFYSEMIFGMIETNERNLSKRSLSPINFEKNIQDKRIKLSELHVIEDMRNFRHFDPPFMQDNQPFPLQSQNSSLVFDNEEQCSQGQFDRLFYQYIKLDKIDQSKEKMQLEAQNWISAQRLKQSSILDGKNFAEACKFGLYFPNLRKLTINMNDFSNIQGNEVIIPGLTELKTIGQISNQHELDFLLSMLKESLMKLEIDVNNLLRFQADKLNLRNLRELKLTGSCTSKEELRELEKHNAHLSEDKKLQGEKISSFLLNSRSSLKMLDFSDARLIGKSKKLTYSIGELSGLTYLNLSKNRFTAIPKALKNLKNLVHLDFSDNKIKIGIPEWMASLSKLTHLDLSKNEITSIPETIETLQKLTYLNFSLNCIKRLPNKLWNLKQLSHLDLSGNDISTISSMIKNAENLIYLDISNNRIKELPRSIKNLKNLTHLDLFGNKTMMFLPQSITNLLNLRYLDIRCTGIVSLPISKNKYRLDLNEVYLSNLAYINTYLYFVNQYRSNMNTRRNYRRTRP